MKANKLFTAFALIFVCTMATGVTSCSKDDDDDNGSSSTYQKLYSGTWVNGIYSYNFSSNGRGYYHVGTTSWADFKYSIDGTSVTMRDFTYVNTTYGDVWHSNSVKYGIYHPDNDTFSADGKLFTRQ